MALFIIDFRITEYVMFSSIWRGSSGSVMEGSSGGVMEAELGMKKLVNITMCDLHLYEIYPLTE